MGRNVFRRQSVPIRLSLREMSGFYYSWFSSWRNIMKHVRDQGPKGLNGVVCHYNISDISNLVQMGNNDSCMGLI